METIFTKAELKDRDELIDLANYVFSHSGGSVDFPSLLPKLYKNEYFMDNIHYVAKEDGRIKAVIGAYPLELEFSNQKTAVQGRGIGMVSVHPYCRGKGYMKTLIKMALNDMKNDGIVFSCLGGQRQRYEYYGFVPAGISFSFDCEGVNIRHKLGKENKTSLSISRVNPGDDSALDEILAMHGKKSLRIKRERIKLFDTLSSWYDKIYLVKEGNHSAGYFIVNGSNRISEIFLDDYSRMIEVIDLLFKETGNDSASVSAAFHDFEKIKYLQGFAEHYRQSHSYQFAVLDFAKFTDALVKHKASYSKTATGSFVLEINNDYLQTSSKIRIFANENEAGAEETNETPELTLNSKEACSLLFSPLEAHFNPKIRENDFLKSLLPLPLNIESADRI